MRLYTHMKTATVLLLLVITPIMASAHGDEEHDYVIEMRPEGFDPSTIIVKKGDIIEFRNLGNQLHWPASNIHPTHRLYPDSDIEKCGASEKGMFDACRTLQPGESYSFQFDHTGTWRFHDHAAPQLKGKIIVEAVKTAEKNYERQSIYKISTQSTSPSLSKGIALFFKRLGDLFRIGTRKPLIEKNTELIFNDREALRLYVEEYGPGETVQRLHQLGATYGNCHNAAHDAGRFGYELKGGTAFQKCSAECHSGCYHGATEAYFRDSGTANLIDDLNFLCQYTPSAFYDHQCVHGIGHGIMAWADYEILEALETCDRLPRLQQSCHSGVFMENIIGGLADTEGHFTEYLSDDPHFPCNILPEQYVGACYFYQTSRMVQLFKGDFEKVADACEEIDEQYQHLCFASMGRDVGGVHRGNPAMAIAACNVVQNQANKESCLSGAVQDTFWETSGQDAAQTFCRMLTTQSEKQSCYNTIFSRATQVLSSGAEQKRFCDGVEESFEDECRKKTD